MAETIQLAKDEYDDMVEYMERMRETVEVLSNKSIIKKINEALHRIESGEFLTKKDMCN